MTTVSSISSTMTLHSQINTKSTVVQPPQSHPLPQRPKTHPPPPSMPLKPHSICRNYSFWGSCRDTQCSRAHVPYRHMLDLFDYLLERDDCPSELRDIRRRFTRPSPAMVNRRERQSDLICSEFLESDGFCRYRHKCYRAHFRSYNIYQSLLPSGRTFVNDPVPEMTDCVTQEPLLADNTSPHPTTVQLPSASFCDREPTLIESDVVEPLQSSVADPAPPQQSLVVDPVPPPTVRLPKLAEPQQASAAESPATEHQRENSLEISGASPTSLDPNATVDAGPITEVCSVVSMPVRFVRPVDQSPAQGPRDDVQTVRDSPSLSEVCSTEPSSDAASAISTLTDGRTPVRSKRPATTNSHDPTPAAVTPPSKVRKPIGQSHTCRDWLAGRCRYNPCKFRHDLPPSHTPVNNTVQEASGRQSPQDPPAAQTSAVSPSSPPDPMLHSTAVGSPMTAVQPDPSVIVTGAGNNTHPAPPPPYAQPKNPSTTPSTHVETRSSRSRLPPRLQQQPPKLQEQTLPPKLMVQALAPESQEPAPAPKSQEQTPAPISVSSDITLSVLESTNVKFSGGFLIEKIVTAFESLWFVIEDVPKSVGRTEIENLVAPFGVVQDVRFRDERQSDNPFSRTVSVQMTGYREVVQAINGLDGKDVFGRRIAVHLSLGKKLSKRMLRDNCVQVSWPVPCKAGYAGYSTLEAAQNAVSKADGWTERGYWITASMYQSIPIIDAYNVRFTGLPPWTDREFLDKFGPSEGTMLERPNYAAPDFAIPAVRKILASFGKITRFQVAPSPYRKGFIRALCYFESLDVAGSACELHRVPQRSLNMQKIFVKRMLSVVEHVPRPKFKQIKQDLLRLQQEVWDHTLGAHLDILSQFDGEETALKLVAEDSKTLARLRVELKEILDGEILKEDGQQVWDDFLRRDAGRQFLEQLRSCNPDVSILVHSFRRCIRLIGTTERRQPVASAILDKFSSLREHKVHVIPIDSQAMGVLASPDLTAAQQRYGKESICIDLQGQNICVRGPDNLYEEVQEIVHTAKLRHGTGLGDDNCPVCLEPPFSPVSLCCGHKWCKACFVSYLSAAADTRSFPISCLGNQGKCKELVPMKMAQWVLPPTDFDALALAAFHAYVQARPTEYHYCPTPDCPQAYPSASLRNAPLSCPSCLARICPSCHVEYHEGVDCADREDGGDRLFQEWMRTHDVKKCPGCAAPIERAAGCNHMTCTRCRTHTCWVCLQTFAQGQGIYDHMREFHGGIGL